MRLRRHILALAIAAGERSERAFLHPAILSAAEILHMGKPALTRDHPERAAGGISEQHRGDRRGLRAGHGGVAANPDPLVLPLDTLRRNRRNERHALEG